MELTFLLILIFVLFLLLTLLLHWCGS